MFSIEARDQLSLGELPPGIERQRASWSLDTVFFEGEAKALADAGLLSMGWLEGLGHLQRDIVLQPHDGFRILGEGKGNRLSPRRKQAGAVQVKRVLSGKLMVTHFNCPPDPAQVETHRKSEAEREERARQFEQATWQAAKQVSQQPDFPARWKNGVLHEIDQAKRLVDGRLCFTDFPDIELSPEDQKAALAALREAERVLQAIRPRVKITEQVSNVISFKRSALDRIKPTTQEACHG